MKSDKHRTPASENRVDHLCVYSKQILHTLLCASVDSFEDKVHPYNSLRGRVKVLMSVTMKKCFFVQKVLN